MAQSLIPAIDTNQIFNPTQALGQAQNIAANQYNLNMQPLKQQMAEQEIAEKKLNRIAQYAAMATPENYNALRQKAIQEGLATDEMLPKEYNKPWLDQINLKLNNKASDIPSAVQEYNFVRSLNEKDRELYMQTKRATPYLNLGTSMVQPSPISGNMPLNKFDIDISGKSQQQEIGKEQGVNKSSLMAAEATLPQLEKSVEKLKDIGKKATYTTTGKIVNALVKESGLPATEGAINRAAYVAHVKNNILPLLRQTFGAQFTRAEGDSLLATMGDPNSTPEEKQAVLDALIEDKKSHLETMRRQAQSNTPAVQLQTDIAQGEKLIGTSGGKNVYQLPDGTYEMDE